LEPICRAEENVNSNASSVTIDLPQSHQCLFGVLVGEFLTVGRDKGKLSRLMMQRADNEIENARELFVSAESPLMVKKAPKIHGRESQHKKKSSFAYLQIESVRKTNSNERIFEVLCVSLLLVFAHSFGLQNARFFQGCGSETCKYLHELNTTKLYGNYVRSCADFEARFAGGFEFGDR
jgi:hypothetical protein